MEPPIAQPLIELDISYDPKVYRKLAIAWKLRNWRYELWALLKGFIVCELGAAFFYFMASRVYGKPSRELFDQLTLTCIVISIGHYLLSLIQALDLKEFEKIGDLALILRVHKSGMEFIYDSGSRVFYPFNLTKILVSCPEGWVIQVEDQFMYFPTRPLSNAGFDKKLETMINDGTTKNGSSTS